MARTRKNWRTLFRPCNTNYKMQGFLGPPAEPCRSKGTKHHHLDQVAPISCRGQTRATVGGAKPSRRREACMGRTATCEWEDPSEMLACSRQPS